MNLRIQPQAALVLGALLSVAACGEHNTNDFSPADNPLRRGSEGQDDEELRELRRRGLPSTIEEAEAARTGVLLRVENAVAWPRGAKDAPTACHMNVRLCGIKKERVVEEGKARTERTPVNCQELRGTVNQGETEVFYLSAGAALRTVKDTNNGYNMELQYKTTCQVTSTWYGGGEPELNPEIFDGKQEIRVKLLEARPTSYGVELESTFTPK